MSKIQSLSFDKVKKLLTINKMLTQSINIDKILDNVIVAASELIELAGMFIIYLYDEKTNRLQFAEGKGIDKKFFKKITITPGESLEGKTFVSKKSKLVTAKQEICQYIENLSEKNFQHFAQGVQYQNITCTLAVPIVNNNKCYGVVVVNHMNQDGQFSEEDMEVIEIVASQIAIAIEHSRIYEHLREKNKLLKQSISIHDRFYRLIIEGKGMDKVTQLLERMINSPVSFALTLNDSESENVFPVVRGNEILGYLKLQQPVSSFSYMEQIAIEQASLSIAIELIKNNTVFEQEIVYREKIFKQIIEKDSEQDLYYALQYLKWNKNWKVQCLIMEGKDSSLWKREKLVDKERFIHSVERITQSLGFRSLTFARGFRLIIIIPKLQNDSMGILIREMRKQFNEMKIIYGIGRETTIDNLELSYHEAVRSVGYAKLHQIELVEYASLGIERLLYEVDEDILNMFIHDKLRNLSTLDESFIDTLQYFIKMNKNHKQTAELLHIHLNKLNYQLQKIEEVLQIDFDDEKDWIDLVIAFRLYIIMKK